MREKINLKNVTFTIPVRYDTNDRIVNIRTVLKFLITNFDTNIIILEADKEPIIYRHIKEFMIHSVKYVFEKDDNPIYHRTKYLNTMAKMCTTPVVVNYDADVVYPVKQYVEALNAVTKEEYAACTMFDSFTWHVKKQYINKIFDSASVNWLTEVECYAPHRHAVAKGGAVFWNIDKFKKVGMENENFVSYGAEDECRVIRVQKLFGEKGWKRVRGPIFHLEHDRLQNSSDSHPYVQQNNTEFEKVKSMTKEQLEEYIKTWTWNK